MENKREVGELEKRGGRKPKKQTPNTEPSKSNKIEKKKNQDKRKLERGEGK